MANSATLSFVAAPASSPTVRLDLTPSAGPSYLGGVDDLDLGVPEFEGDPDSVGVEYGYRTCRFTLKLVGTYGSVASTMQSISRELLRRTNWLMVQWQGGTNKPVFLRTYASSLQSLANIQPDFLKFDVSLVRDIDRSSIKRSLLDSLRQLAVKIDARVIAEGVERVEEMATLLDLGIELGQGYHFHREEEQ